MLTDLLSNDHLPDVVCDRYGTDMVNLETLIRAAKLNAAIILKTLVSDADEKYYKSMKRHAQRSANRGRNGK